MEPITRSFYVDAFCILYIGCTSIFVHMRCGKLKRLINREAATQLSHVQRSVEVLMVGLIVMPLNIYFFNEKWWLNYIFIALALCWLFIKIHQRK